MKIVIFGAGVSGRMLASNYLQEGDEILCFVDNDSQKHGKTIAVAGGGANE